MRRNSLKKNKIVILILIIILCTMSISYAMLTKTLTTNYANITQTPLNYNTIFAFASTTGTNTSYCGSVTVTNNYQITINGAKIFAGKNCDYIVGVYNNSGSGLATKLNSIEAVYPTGLSNCSANSSKSYFGCDLPGTNSGRIRYTLSENSDFSTNLSSGLVIADGVTKNLYIRISNTATGVEENATISGGGYILHFVAQ